MVAENGRSSCGSVDWNPATSGISILGIVAPLVGAWIEILQEFRSARRNTVAPLVGAWIEIRAESERDIAVAVAPLVGAWIEI